MRQPAVYIMASRRNGTLYTGVTSDLPRRAYEHREGLIPGFTSRYGCKLPVWYEDYEVMVDAIAREKQIKAGSRKKKLADRSAEPAMARLLRAAGMTICALTRHCEPQAKQPRPAGAAIDIVIRGHAACKADQRGGVALGCFAFGSQ
jgi:putative endonuclease